MKKFKYLILAILSFVIVSNVFALDNTLKLYDYAQILKDNEEEKIRNDINKYINKYNIDMVVITVKYHTQPTTEDYVNAFYNKNEFGKGINKNGIVIVFDLMKDDMLIKTFGKVKGYYSENEINKILNEVNDENNYYKKFKKFITYSNKYVEEYEVNEEQDVNIFSYVNYILITILSIIIPIIVISVLILKNKTVRKQYTADYYIVEESVIINVKEDKYVTTNTKKKRLNSK